MNTPLYFKYMHCYNLTFLVLSQKQLSWLKYAISSPDGFPLRWLLSAIPVPSCRHSVKDGHTFPRDCDDVKVLRSLRTANQPGKHPVLFYPVSVALGLKSGRVCLENNILLPYTMDKKLNTSVLKSMHTILYTYIYTKAPV